MVVSNDCPQCHRPIPGNSAKHARIHFLRDCDILGTLYTFAQSNQG